jgi:hypothetical protein
MGELLAGFFDKHFAEMENLIVGSSLEDFLP